MKSLAKNCLRPIFGEDSVTFQKFNKYVAKIQDEWFKTEHTAFGNADDWHGSPDLRIDQVYVVSTGNGEDEVESCSVTVEGKSLMKDKHINQCVATSITSSFITYNIATAAGKSINPMLPCIHKHFSRMYIRLC